MSFYDKVLGIEEKIINAQNLYESGNYKQALKELCMSPMQSLTISKQAFFECMYLSAQCFYAIEEYDLAKKMLDKIINYPDFNHNFISKAEAMKKEINCRIE